MRAVIAFLALATTANAADLGISFTDAGPQQTARVGGLYTANVTVGNRSASEPSGATVEIAFDPAITVDQIHQFTTNMQCQVGIGKITCTTPEVRFGSNHVGMTLRMPAAPDGGDFELTATVTAPGADPDLSNNTAKRAFHVIRQMIVDNVNDDGPGSLRAAIVNANGWCSTTRPCEIQFRFPDGHVPVIEPLTPLPPLTACDVLVGEPSQLNRPARIHAVVSGRRLASGSGLVLRNSCHAQADLFGLTIRDFPEDGIVVESGFHWLEEFSIRSNGRWGILANSGLVVLNISEIGGNARSGMVVRGRAWIFRSRIGIAEDGSDIANGASGIFAAPGSGELRVATTTIANHPHFGLALAGRGPLDIGSSTVIKDNILDLARLAAAPAAPRILSARYDAAANTTRVTLVLTEPDAAKTANLDIRLWASDRITIFGTAHLEQLIANRWIDAGASTSEPIAIDVPGDLRGKQISAVMTIWTRQPFLDSPAPAMFDTSEVSAAVRVE